MGTGQDEAHGPKIRVESYSGYRAEERPVSFHVSEERRVVERVMDQWAGEDHHYFKLLADDRKVYVLRYDRFRDQWTLERVANATGEEL